MAADRHPPLGRGLAFAFFVPDLLIAPRLQWMMNQHSKVRTELMRELNQGIAGGDGVPEQASTSFDTLIGKIYDARVRLYAIKIIAKFLNNFPAQLGALAVLVFGGMMVIEGRTDIGVVVAFISGFERIIEPARDLLDDYRQQSQMRVQYKMIRESVPTLPPPAGA